MATVGDFIQKSVEHTQRHVHGDNNRRLSTVQISLLWLVLLVVAHPTAATATTIDFEGMPDSTILTNQYPGLTFTNALILTSGISLNEFEFPPHSGVNVISDNGGPMTINFSTPITSFSGYFTYLEPLSLLGFNAGDIEVASASSTYSTNDALYGDPGSSPNEFITITFTGGMSSITTTGEPAGGSFALDDLTYSLPSPAEVPEPRVIAPFLIGLSLSVLRKSKK